MNDAGQTLLGHFVSLLPLLGAAIAWYVSSRLTVSAIASHPRATMRRSAAQCIPVLLLALTAVVRHEPQIAIGIIFGSSVATLSLVLGVVTFSAPPDMIGVDARRRWGFVLPAAVLVFLAGFQSQFTLLHAAALAFEGVMVLLVWTGVAEGEGVLRQTAGTQTASSHFSILTTRLVIAVALALVGSWYAVSGAKNLLTNSSLPSMSIIAALLLGPVLVIATIGTDVTLAQHGDYTDAVSSQAGFVLLNLCVILPLVIVAWYVESIVSLSASASALPVRIAMIQTDSPLNFPLIVWRVDCVMLIVLGLALLPISLGRWLPRRAEGLLLIAMYAAYMVLWRWGSEMS